MIIRVRFDMMLVLSTCTSIGEWISPPVGRQIPIYKQPANGLNMQNVDIITDASWKQILLILSLMFGL